MESASTFRKTRQGSVWNVMPEKIGDSAVNVHWDVYKRNLSATKVRTA